MTAFSLPSRDSRYDIDDRYDIDNVRDIASPALVVFRDLVISNIESMVRIAGDVARLRPHCKTHKMPAVASLQLERGITRHKAATLAEAEMLARAGARDVLLAYHVVGPNIARSVRYRETFPDVAFSVIADDRRAITSLGDAMRARGLSVDVLLDIDTGQHRTGVPPGDAAAKLYRQIHAHSGLVPRGLHVYDGHQKQISVGERSRAVREVFDRVLTFRDALRRDGLDVPGMVCGGTVTFPVYAQMDDPTIQLSPGTCVFHDYGYGQTFPDLDFVPAAVLITRVISRTAPQRVTLDLGYKAVASDQPLERRVYFPQLPAARPLLQNEEHLLLEVSPACRLGPGDVLLGIPGHICPTSALHKIAHVVEDGKCVGQWEVAARDRCLTI